MKKLIVEEFQVDEKTVEKRIGDQYEVGEVYSHFKDPETGKFYRPRKEFIVEAREGENLKDRFIEIK